MCNLDDLDQKNPDAFPTQTKCSSQHRSHLFTKRNMFFFARSCLLRQHGDRKNPTSETRKRKQSNSPGNFCLPSLLFQKMKQDKKAGLSLDGRSIVKLNRLSCIFASISSSCQHRRLQIGGCLLFLMTMYDTTLDGRAQICVIFFLARTVGRHQPFFFLIRTPSSSWARR